MMKVRFTEEFRINPPVDEKGKTPVMIFKPGDEVDAGSLLDGGKHIEIFFVDNNGIQRSCMLCLHNYRDKLTVVPGDSNDVILIYCSGDGNSRTDKISKYRCSGCGCITTKYAGANPPDKCSHCNCIAAKTVRINKPVQ